MRFIITSVGGKQRRLLLRGDSAGVVSLWNVDSAAVPTPNQMPCEYFLFKIYNSEPKWQKNEIRKESFESNIVKAQARFLVVLCGYLLPVIM